MTSTSTALSTLARLPSGIPGLDTVLGGGFFESGVYILHGLPGCGKTIFANQLCYRHVANGGSAVYVTLLAESHSRMLQHIKGLSFFDESVIPDRLSYLSAFSDLENDGLKGLMALLRREMRARNVSVLILDGLVAAAEAAETDRELKKFVHEVQTSAVFHGCTVFMLTSGSPQRVNAEHTMVDGIIELDDRLYDARSERTLQVRKFRGARSLRGKHSFRITDDGLVVFPRIEALFDQPPTDRLDAQGLSTGVPTLDALIAARGFTACSSTVLLGTSGTGKTTLSLHFLKDCTPESPGLLFGFFESPSRLRAKARAFGFDLEALERSGAVHIIWSSQGEHLIDEMGHRVLDDVNRLGIKRLAIDGLSGFFESAVFPERTNRFFSCLTNELRRRGVTVVMTLETRDTVGTTVTTGYGVSGFVDNLLFVRFVEERGQVKRLVTITKMRDSDFQAGLYELQIGNGGLRVLGLHSAEGDVIPTSVPVSGAASAVRRTGGSEDR